MDVAWDFSWFLVPEFLDQFSVWEIVTCLSVVCKPLHHLCSTDLYWECRANRNRANWKKIPFELKQVPSLHQEILQTCPYIFNNVPFTPKLAMTPLTKPNARSVATTARADSWLQEVTRIKKKNQFINTLRTFIILGRKQPASFTWLSSPVGLFWLQYYCKLLFLNADSLLPPSPHIFNHFLHFVALIFPVFHGTKSFHVIKRLYSQEPFVQMIWRLPEYWAPLLRACPSLFSLNIVRTLHTEPVFETLLSLPNDSAQAQHLCLTLLVSGGRMAGAVAEAEVSRFLDYADTKTKTFESLLLKLISVRATMPRFSNPTELRNFLSQIPETIEWLALWISREDRLKRDQRPEYQKALKERSTKEAYDFLACLSAARKKP